MQELLDTIDKIRHTIKEHSDALSKNEMLTRYALIDPLLRAMGWDLSNPSEAIPEDNAAPGGKTDYTLGNNDMIVEAKKLNEKLDKHADTLRGYLKSRRARFGILTNGQTWKIYDAGATTKSPSGEFDITDSSRIVLAEVVALHRLIISDAIPDEVGNEPPKHDDGGGGTSQDTLLVKERPTNNTDGMALNRLAYMKGMSPPKYLMHRTDGYRKSLNSWMDLLVGVAEWLVSNNHLTRLECPFPIGPKRYLVHTRPRHRDGQQFPRYKQIGNLYLCTHFDPDDVVKYANMLAQLISLDTSYFRVAWD